MNSVNLTLAAALSLAIASGCAKKPSLPQFNPKPGSLELCIVANDKDDDEAIDAAKEYFASAAENPKIQAELKALAEKGEPPPGPKAGDRRRFTFKGRDTTFRWVEVEAKLFTQVMSNLPGQINLLAAEVSDARDEGLMVVVGDEDSISYPRVAIWSRGCINKSLDPNDRAAKAVDYFILIRESESGKEITEAHLKYFGPYINRSDSRPMIDFEFDPIGGKRLRELSKANKQENEHDRALAIIIGGKVVALNTLDFASRGNGLIYGNFTTGDVNELVKRVRQ